MVPADGPLSYEGTLVSLSWAVVARRASVVVELAIGDTALGPPMTPELEVSLEPTYALARAPVIGIVTIRGGGEVGSLSVALCYRERADYAPDAPPFTAREIAQELPLAGSALADGHTYRFSLRLPEDTLPNYRAKHGELRWELEARWAGSGDDLTATTRVESPVSVAA